jgi:3-hydroxybutyryl-CoA dehydrogenase
MGPTHLFHLGADENGLATFCERYSDSFNRWWDDLGDPRLDPDTVAELIDGLAPVTDAVPYAELLARRDALVPAVVAATHASSRGRDHR